MPRVLVVLLALLLAACGAAAPDPQAARSEAATPAPARATAATQAAPELGLLDFSVPAVGGGQIAGADLAGRDVALWFWAPW